MRYLGIDYGMKRTGVAVSDPNGVIAVLKETIPSEDQNLLVERIERIVLDDNVDAIVIGLPVGLSGAASEMTHHVQRFVDILARALEIPIFTHDERLTSTMAKNATKDHKHADIDQVAAQMILQSYLDSHS